MATAAAVPMSIEALAAHVSKLEGELRAVKAKRDTEKQKLASLEAERAGLSTEYARGSVQADEVATNARAIEISKVALAGFETIVAGAQKRYDEPCRELRLRKEADKASAELAHIAALGKEAEAIVGQLSLTLTTAGGNIRRYEAIRKELGVYVNRAQGGAFQFPIPPAVQAANSAMRTADKAITDQLAPLLKMFKR